MTTAAELDPLIEELTVDAYGDEEQLSSFLVGVEEGLTARVLREGEMFEVALADLRFAPDSEQCCSARVSRA